MNLYLNFAIMECVVRFVVKIPHTLSVRSFVYERPCERKLIWKIMMIL